MSLAEAAARLGVSVKVARGAVVRGNVPAIRIGGRWLVLKVPFEAMLAGRSRPEDGDM